VGGRGPSVKLRSFMTRVFALKLGYNLLAVVGLATLAVTSAPAFAANLVTNGSFENVSVAGKSNFFGNVAGWTGGNNLTFVDFPGTADDGSYLSVYGPFPSTSPAGGNFVEGDGDPNYSSAISQTLSGLTIGQKVAVSFYQAAGQQVGFTGPTTEQWQVSLGSVSQLSPMFSLAQAGVGGWQKVNLSFTATATSEVLSFLAKGTPGGAPPISFLDGVSATAAPEPATWGMMILGFGMVGLGLRRRTRATFAFA
jgi:hypothetical protein